MTFLIILALVAGGTDWASGGLLRAEAGGGVRGAARGAATAWGVRNRAARKRRHKTRRGRFINFLQDLVAGSFRGWLAGRKEAHQRRKQRYADEPLPIVRATRAARRRIANPEPDPEPDPEDDPEHTVADPPNETPKQDPNGTPNEGSSDPEQTPNANPEETPNEQVNPDVRPPNGDPERVEPPAPATPPEVPIQRGTTPVSDLDNAPAYLRAWDDLINSFEGPEADIAGLEKELQHINDNGSDFHNGSENDALSAVTEAKNAVARAKEMVDVARNAAHSDLDASVDAASGKNATAHSAMQEA